MTLVALPPERGPWWTDADQAEWRCFTRELALGSIEHFRHCPGCRLQFPCSRLLRGFELAFDWLHRQIARSKAEYLRAELEAKAAAA